MSPKALFIRGTSGGRLRPFHSPEPFSGQASPGVCEAPGRLASSGPLHQGLCCPGGAQEGCGVKGLPEVMSLGSVTAAGSQSISAQCGGRQVRKRGRPQSSPVRLNLSDSPSGARPWRCTIGTDQGWKAPAECVCPSPRKNA